MLCPFYFFNCSYNLTFLISLGSARSSGPLNGTSPENRIFTRLYGNVNSNKHLRSINNCLFDCTPTWNACVSIFQVILASSLA